MTATGTDVREKRKPRASLRAALAGIGICGFIGPLLPLLVLIPMEAFRDRHSLFYALAALKILPFAWPVAVISMGPAGAILGAMGALWICFRSRTIPSKRLFVETSLAGPLLGTLVPLPVYLFSGIPNHSFLRDFVLLGAISGLLCPLLVLIAMKRHGLLATTNTSG